MESSFEALLEQRILGLTIALFIACFSSWIAFKSGFFRLPANPIAGKRLLSWQDVFKVFSLFIGVELFSAPLFQLIILSFQNHFNTQTQPDATNYGWINLAAMIATGIVLGLYFFKGMDPSLKEEVAGEQAGNRKSYNFSLGIVSWFIVFPWVAVIGQMMGIVLHFFYDGPELEQVAVRLLRSSLGEPFLLVLTILTIITIVPFVEELMFRGFLQTWLKSHFGSVKAIICTSMIFSLFHYSESQGIENIELLVSLFVLSCFLGYLRERQNSLWASIGLHSTFNSISLMMIIMATFESRSV